MELLGVSVKIIDSLRFKAEKTNKKENYRKVVIKEEREMEKHNTKISHKIGKKWKKKT